MEEVKGILQSRTIWGIIVSVLAGLASKYGYEITPELQDGLITSTLDAISVGAGIYAGYARVKATKKIGK
jgi:hypothetical protein